MVRYQILVEYVGTLYKGWQIQKKGKTVQGLIHKFNKTFERKYYLGRLWQN